LEREVTVVPAYTGMEFGCGLSENQGCAPRLHLEPRNMWGSVRN